MRFWRAVTDKSFPPWCQQTELKCEDSISVQRQPGFYPDRSMPGVCHVSFQLRICVRTITCLQLSVKNMVGSGSKRHKNKHSSHEFLQKSSLVVSGLLPPIITWLPTCLQACHWSQRWYNTVFLLSVHNQTPLSRKFQSGKTVGYILLVRHSQLCCERKKVPFPVHLQGRRNWSSKQAHTHTLVHELQTFAHSTHTQPTGTGEGLTGAQSADAALLQMGSFCRL